MQSDIHLIFVRWIELIYGLDIISDSEDEDVFLGRFRGDVHQDSVQCGS